MYNNLIATKSRLTLKVPNIILISFIQVDNNFNDIITYTVNIKKLYEKNIDLLEKNSPINPFFSTSQPTIE